MALPLCDHSSLIVCQAKLSVNDERNDRSFDIIGVVCVFELLLIDASGSRSLLQHLQLQPPKLRDQRLP